MEFHGALYPGESHCGGAFKKIGFICGLCGCLADNVVNGTPNELGWDYHIAYVCSVYIKRCFYSQAVHDGQRLPELVDTGVVISDGDCAVLSILPYGNLGSPFVVRSKTTSRKDDRQRKERDIKTSHKIVFGIS